MTSTLSLNTAYPTPYELVHKFHDTYGQSIRTSPVLDVPERKMRVALILEEMDEYLEAEENDDVIEIYDALGDLVYVAQGAAITHGLDLALAIEQVLTAKELDAEVVNHYNRYMAGLGMELNMADADRKWAERAVSEAAQAYVTAESADDLELMTKTLARLIVTCYAVAASYGVNLDIILAEIQRSNMSKLGEDGKPIYYTDGPKKGKVIKGPNFSEPDLGAILYPGKR